MPTDINGVYSLPSGYLAVDGTTVLSSQHNPPLEDLAASMTLRMMTSGVTPMLGQLRGISGSAAAPSFTFSGATTSGVYQTSNGIGVAVGGVQVAEFTSAGMASGARYLGELIQFTGTTALALTVFPYGQTLSRATYAALWAFAQTEISAGNTFYNNGNGTTTFGIGDLRGRVVAGKDNMGGVAATRLTTISTPIGSAGGAETIALVAAQIPSITSSGTGAISPSIRYIIADELTTTFSTGSGGATSWRAWNISAGVTQNNPTISVSATSNNTNGSTHSNVQPTIVSNYLLFAGA